MKEKVRSGQNSFKDGNAAREPVIKIRIEEPFIIHEPIDVSALREEEKIPNENIEIRRLDWQKTRFNAPLVDCSIRRGTETKDSVYLEVNGRQRGGDDSRVVLFIMVYNAENDLIAYNSNFSTGGGIHSVGHPPFSDSVEVPKDEKISKIVLQFGLDPLQF